MIRLIDIYKNLKQILEDSNVALVNKGLNAVNFLHNIPFEVKKLDKINRLPYVLRKEIIELNEDDFGEGVIKSYSLNDCKNLINITIGNNVTHIQNYNFYGIELENIYIRSITPPTIDSYISFHVKTIHVPIGYGDVYKSATNWSRYAGRIVEDIIL
jgi:hypothetical protein